MIKNSVDMVVGYTFEVFFSQKNGSDVRDGFLNLRGYLHPQTGFSME